MAYGSKYNPVVPRYEIYLGGGEGYDEMEGSDTALDRYHPSETSDYHQKQSVFPAQPGKDRECLYGKVTCGKETAPEKYRIEEEQPFPLHPYGGLHAGPHI